MVRQWLVVVHPWHERMAGARRQAGSRACSPSSVNNRDEHACEVYSRREGSDNCWLISERGRGVAVRASDGPGCSRGVCNRRGNSSGASASPTDLNTVCKKDRPSMAGSISLMSENMASCRMRWIRVQLASGRCEHQGTVRCIKKQSRQGLNQPRTRWSARCPKDGLYHPRTLRSR